MSSYEELLPELYAILKPFAGDKPLGETTELVADLGLDSVQVMELLLQIEDRFDISIPLNILPGVRTVRDLARQLQTMLRQPP